MKNPSAHEEVKTLTKYLDESPKGAAGPLAILMLLQGLKSATADRRPAYPEYRQRPNDWMDILLSKLK